MKKQLSLGLYILLASHSASGFNFDEIQSTVKSYEQKRLLLKDNDNNQSEEIEKTLSYLLDSLKNQYIRQIELTLSKMDLSGLDNLSRKELNELENDSDQLLHTLESYSKATINIAKAEKLTQLNMELTVLLPEKYGVRVIQKRLIRNMSYLKMYQIH